MALGGVVRSIRKDLISEPVVLTVILFNSLVHILTLAYPEGVARLDQWIEWVDVLCVGFFVLEVILKLQALGAKGYFSDHWNKFDFTVTLLSTPLLLSPFIDIPPGIFENIAIIRMARLLRLFRLMRFASSGSAIGSLRRPIFALLLLIVLNEVAGVVEADAEIADWLEKGFAFLIIFSATWLIERAYSALHVSVFEAKSEAGDWEVDPTLLAFLKSFIQVALYLVGFLVALQAIGQDPIHVFAGIGIGGMAIAFAAKDTVSNLIGGLMLFATRPFRVGERILVHGIDGWVQRIGLRETELLDFYGERTYVPNKLFMDTGVRNIDIRPYYLIRAQLKLHHDMTSAQIDRALKIFTEITHGHDLVLERHWTCFDSIEQDGFMLSFWYYIERWTPEDEEKIGNEFDKMYAVQSWVNLEIMRRFETEGIRLALPIEVHHHPGEAPKGLFGTLPREAAPIPSNAAE